MDYPFKFSLTICLEDSSRPTEEQNVTASIILCENMFNNLLNLNKVSILIEANHIADSDTPSDVRIDY